jgi:prolipoprotein diacylglyceryl transferase
VTTTILASFPSPSQGVWHLGFIPIRAYALFILVGVIVALVIGDRRWTARGGEPGVIYDIALWAIILGLIGGRLYHVLTDWSTYFGPGGAGLEAAFKIQEGGLGIWGAVALGGVGAWIGCRRRGIPLPAFGDAIAPGIVLAQAIGRIGNYFNQELYGRPTTMPWGLEIYERRDAHGALDSLNGVSTGQLIETVHPTFLYELLWDLLVFVLLIWIDRRYRIGHGRLFAMYVAAYCFGRFWVELMRSDMATHIAGIRINSFVSVFVFIGAVVYIMVAPKGREDPSSLRGNAEEEQLAPDEDERSPADELTKELAAVAATTGVVAAVKAAGEKEDEDAAAAHKADADDASDDEAEPVAEAEQLAEDVETAPAEDIAEAAQFAEAGEEADAADTAAVGGVGAVEGDEVVEAEEAVPEVHEAAVESTEDAAEVADEVAARDEPGEDAAEEDAAEGDSEPEAEAVGGVGAVEGDEVVEAEDAAEVADEVAAGDEPGEDAAEEDAAVGDSEPEAEAVGGVGAVEGDEEAAEVADEVAAEEPGDVEVEHEAEQPAEGDATGGLGAVEGDEVAVAEQAAPEVHKAAVEDAEDAAATAETADDSGATSRFRMRWGRRSRRT